MWVAWTVAGGLGFGLALLASIRIIKKSLHLRKVRWMYHPSIHPSVNPPFIIPSIKLQSTPPRCPSFPLTRRPAAALPPRLLQERKRAHADALPGGAVLWQQPPGQAHGEPTAYDAPEQYKGMEDAKDGGLHGATVAVRPSPDLEP